MSDDYEPITIIPLPAEIDPKTQALLDAGILERETPYTVRLTEAGFSWIVSWLPGVLSVLINRAESPAMQKLVELARENQELRGRIAELEAFLAPPRDAWRGMMGEVVD